jgi:hypothetical protein
MKTSSCRSRSAGAERRVGRMGRTKRANKEPKRGLLISTNSSRMKTHLGVQAGASPSLKTRTAAESRRRRRNSLLMSRRRQRTLLRNTKRPHRMGIHSRRQAGASGCQLPAATRLQRQRQGLAAPQERRVAQSAAACCKRHLCRHVIRMCPWDRFRLEPARLQSIGCLRTRMLGRWGKRYRWLL